MKKKSNKIFAILIGIAVAYYVLRVSGILVLYAIPSSGSEPTIKSGSFILATNLKTPKRGDVITFIFKDRLHPDAPIQELSYIFRLTAIANDTLEIKKGIVYVNGKNVDAQLELKHSYLLSQAQFDKLENPPLDAFNINEDTKMVFLEDAIAKKYALENKQFIEDKGIENDFIKEKYQQNWNKDHFGPLVIPEGKIFVLGDNRDDARDSRTIGLINASAITGVHWVTLF
ncbi:signal peptidase I [Kordia jejudonensis]|uniref:signal peptidase I n=1 Tax=Kordia jejudonensis TaxID=1348245 RepID=UPI0006293849|nr:signal peptidase I [Kordia jejudonensis]